MSDSPRYLIDSNILIEAHRHYYKFNLSRVLEESRLAAWATSRIESGQG